MKKKKKKKDNKNPQQCVSLEWNLLAFLSSAQVSSAGVVVVVVGV